MKLGAVVSLALLWSACAQQDPWVVPLEQDCMYSGTFESKSVPTEVELLSLGEDYQIQRTKLRRTPGGLAWPFDLDRQRPQLYLISQDGALNLDDSNPLSVQINGQEWSYLPAKQCEQPTFQFVSRERQSQEQFITVQMIRGQGGQALDPDSVIAKINDAKAEFKTIDDQVLVNITDLSLGKYHLELFASDLNGRSTTKFRHPFWMDPSPYKWSAGLLYQVVTDRFAGFNHPPDENWTIGKRRGGTWKGIQNQIEDGYFERLGVTSLWISPINRNADGLWVGVEGGPARYEGYHGYWRTSNQEVESAFGSELDLQRMIESAHSKGIRVILDVVLNHQHADFTDGEPSRIRSNSRCVCGQPQCPWWRDIERCWFTPYLPDLDYGNPATIESEVNDLIELVSRFNFDGLRLDAVPMMPRFVIRHVKQRVRAHFEGLDTQFLILGETFTGAQGYEHIRYYLGKHGLDGQFDFPLMWGLREAFGTENVSLSSLPTLWQKSEQSWSGSNSQMALMVGNHDVARFMSVALNHELYRPWAQPPDQPEDHRAYAQLLMAQSVILGLPGLPTLYYGDEVGLVGASDPDNRRPMPQTSELSARQKNLLEQTARMGRSRKCIESKLDKDVEFVIARKSELVMMRKSRGKPALFVAINRSNTPSEIEIPLDLWTQEGRAQTWVDHLTMSRIETDEERLSLMMAPHSVRWLTPTLMHCQSGVTE